jgi:hypothetical protein
MDTFFGPGGMFNDNPFFDIRIPYAGQIPPPGYTLFQDSITYFSPTPWEPFMYPPIYSSYLW